MARNVLSGGSRGVVVRRTKAKRSLLITGPQVRQDKQADRQRREAVLAALSGAPSTLQGISRLMGLDDSTTHSVLRVLRDEGLIHTDRGYWVLGHRRA